jgi:hypothetical protein
LLLQSQNGLQRRWILVKDLPAIGEFCIEQSEQRRFSPWLFVAVGEVAGDLDGFDPHRRPLAAAASAR